MRERDRVLGHAEEADGIEEYDNPLPGWWTGLFVVTVLFGVVYAVDYHFVSRRSQVAAWEAEMAAAPAPLAVATVVASPEALAAGKALYAANCVGCHGPDLRGGVGPDLTDTTWIHGGTLEQIAHTVSVGVPEKGMLTWGPILGPEKVGHLAAFVHAAGGGQ